jgi:hypothetical protein
MLPNARAEENGSHTRPRGPAVFLTHASPPSHIAAIPSSSDQRWSGFDGPANETLSVPRKVRDYARFRGDDTSGHIGKTVFMLGVDARGYRGVFS